MLTVYGLRNCDSCRKTRKYLNARGIEHRFHDVRQDGLDIATLERWASKVGWETLLNRRSLTWRQVPQSARDDMHEDRALALMAEEPTLVKRPVLESDAFTAVGFPEKRFDEFLAGSA